MWNAMKFMKNHSINQDIIYLNLSHSEYFWPSVVRDDGRWYNWRSAVSVDCPCLILLSSIIIWNCCGFCYKLNNIKSINAKYKPISVILTLQETCLWPMDTSKIKRYSCKGKDTQMGKISGGVCLLYSYDNPSSVINMHRGLKVVAVRVGVRRLITFL